MFSDVVVSVVSTISWNLTYLTIRTKFNSSDILEQWGYPNITSTRPIGSRLPTLTTLALSGIIDFP